MMTNNKDSLYIPKDTNRRYVCFECGDKYATNTTEMKQWWEETRKLIMDQDVGNHFYTYLLNLDTTNYPNPMVVIDTDLRREIINISKDNVLRFADDLPCILREKTTQGTMTYTKKSGITAAVLYKLYTEWCSASGERNVKTATKFGIIAKPVIENKRTGVGIKYYPEIAEELADDEELDDTDDTDDIANS